ALYAARGAGVRRRRRVRARARAERVAAGADAERAALGLLGDLLNHPAREIQQRTSLALEQGRLGVWLLGEAGAVLVRPGGRRVHCYCVKGADPELPAGDRLALLLLGARGDEGGFATPAHPALSR